MSTPSPYSDSSPNLALATSPITSSSSSAQASSPSSSNHNNNASPPGLPIPLIAGVGAGVVVMIISIVVFCLLRRRRQNQVQQQTKLQRSAPAKSGRPPTTTRPRDLEKATQPPPASSSSSPSHDPTLTTIIQMEDRLPQEHNKGDPPSHYPAGNTLSSTPTTPVFKPRTSSRISTPIPFLPGTVMDPTGDQSENKVSRPKKKTSQQQLAHRRQPSAHSTHSIHSIHSSHSFSHDHDQVPIPTPSVPIPKPDLATLKTLETSTTPLSKPTPSAEAQGRPPIIPPPTHPMPIPSPRRPSLSSRKSVESMVAGGRYRISMCHPTPPPPPVLPSPGWPLGTTRSRSSTESSASARSSILACAQVAYNPYSSIGSNSQAGSVNGRGRRPRASTDSLSSEGSSVRRSISLDSTNRWDAVLAMTKPTPAYTTSSASSSPRQRPVSTSSRQTSKRIILPPPGPPPASASVMTAASATTAASACPLRIRPRHQRSPSQIMNANFFESPDRMPVASTLTTPLSPTLSPLAIQIPRTPSIRGVTGAPATGRSGGAVSVGIIHPHAQAYADPEVVPESETAQSAQPDSPTCGDGTTTTTTPAPCNEAVVKLASRSCTPTTAGVIPKNQQPSSANPNRRSRSKSVSQAELQRATLYPGGDMNDMRPLQTIRTTPAPPPPPPPPSMPMPMSLRHQHSSSSLNSNSSGSGYGNVYPDRSWSRNSDRAEERSCPRQQQPHQQQHHHQHHHQYKDQQDPMSHQQRLRHRRSLSVDSGVTAATAAATLIPAQENSSSSSCAQEGDKDSSSKHPAPLSGSQDLQAIIAEAIATASAKAAAIQAARQSEWYREHELAFHQKQYQQRRVSTAPIPLVTSLDLKHHLNRTTIRRSQEEQEEEEIDEEEEREDPWVASTTTPTSVSSSRSASPFYAHIA